MKQKEAKRMYYPSEAPHKLGFSTIKEHTASLTRTIFGQQFLKNETIAQDEAEGRGKLAFTREMIQLFQSEESLYIDTIYDIENAVKQSRVEGFSLSPSDLYRIGVSLEHMRSVRNFLVQREEFYSKLARLSKAIPQKLDVEKDILSSVTEQGDVLDNASHQLRSIRQQLDRTQSQVRTTLQRRIRQAVKDKMAIDEGLTIRNGRLVMPIKAEFKRRINGLIHDVSATGQTVYVEPSEVLPLNNEVRSLEIEEQHEIKRILKALTAALAPHIGTILTGLKTIGEIDALAAKARLAQQLEADVPEKPFGDRLSVMQGKNPVLLLKEKNHDDVIPFTLHLDEDEKCLVITGPNAGGKSVTLKTIGLFSMMLQSGYPIPADVKSHFPFYRSIFVDVGDDQSIENDLSTFSSRLTILREMLRKSDNATLILIDEAGTGTDPDEGSALYQSAIEQLISVDARIFVTTHHGKIKAFVHNHPGAVNASMEFDQQELRPTYKFQKGLPGSSYAFEIAETMNISQDVINRARTHLGEKKSSLEQLILDLEKQQQENYESERALEKQLEEAQKKEKAFEEKYSDFIEKQDVYREKARQEAQKLVDEANARIETVVEAIIKSNASKETIKKAHKSVDDLKRALKAEEKELESKQTEEQETFEEGDSVKLKDSGSVGEILSISGKKALINMNGLKVNTKLSNLEKREEPKEKKKQRFMKSRMTDTSSVQRAASNSLKVRGQRVHEVMPQIPVFIDRAVMSGLKEIEIVHGKGTGALRELVRDELKKDSRVKTFGDAPWDQGGPGKTIAELK